MKVLKVRIQMLSNLYLLDVLWDLRAVARVVHPLSLFRGFWQTLLIAIHHLCYEWQQPCTQSRAQFADASVHAWQYGGLSRVSGNAWILELECLCRPEGSRWRVPASPEVQHG